MKVGEERETRGSYKEGQEEGHITQCQSNYYSQLVIRFLSPQLGMISSHRPIDLWSLYCESFVNS